MERLLTVISLLRRLIINRKLFIFENTKRNFVFQWVQSTGVWWGEGKGARTMLSFGASRRQSSFSHFYSITLYNKFIHSPTTPQSPKNLIRSMRALLKTRWNEMTYIQRMKDDEELWKKPESKQNISPVGFPPNPPSMIWRVDCFLVPG